MDFLFEVPGSMPQLGKFLRWGPNNDIAKEQIREIGLKLIKEQITLFWEWEKLKKLEKVFEQKFREPPRARIQYSSLKKYLSFQRLV